MIKKNLFILLIVAVSVLYGCNTNNNENDEQSIPTEDAEEVLSDIENTNNQSFAEASMQDTSGNIIGNVRFFENDKMILAEALFNEGISSGFHGFHIHETGLCEPEAEDGPFTTAGGHYNPEGTSHGSHLGDMTALQGLEDGSAYLVTALDRISAEQITNENLAVIVHSDPNNFANIPDRYTSSESNSPGPDEETLSTGDAGSRTACGIIQASNQ
ncbi:Cu-Zn family superoxide dismutase [Salibacterium salarium]|uniref:superoxide dismutase family protein n=1 Tax=Salibacterium salarium TaxID=284579 RepID=UPI002789A235|nr:superoxide dismutase family protein [Salibacterium salarium]MDQ0300753.1 Cu-Zn family superoxide dismutase [Salibacterium salarium]